MTAILWKPDWEQTKQAYIRWWQREGMVLWLTADLPAARQPIQDPPPPADPQTRWIDIDYRLAATEAYMARKAFLAESFPNADIQIGPGSLGTFLGSEPSFAWDTVWYAPCIPDPEQAGEIVLNPQNNRWLDVHLALVEKALRHSQGRYLVGIPDLIENLDTLAALRGDTPLLFDLTERPQWVYDRLGEINQAFFQAFDLFYTRVKDETGGSIFNPFAIWGPGKTAKVQCDISASISPRMFRKFVLPHLDAQCRWLDNALYHLDGTTCLQHLDALLETDSIDIIEWTPQAGRPGGGSPMWFDIYKRIRSAGKGVQVVGVEDGDVLPLLDAIGPQGLYIMLNDNPRTMDEAEKLLQAVEPYRK
jgi:hypothetical protein